MTKGKDHPWPTNGATMKYVDRQYDRLTVRIDRLVEKDRKMRQQIHDLKEWIMVHLGGK